MANSNNFLGVFLLWNDSLLCGAMPWSRSECTKWQCAVKAGYGVLHTGEP